MSSLRILLIIVISGWSNLVSGSKVGGGEMDPYLEKQADLYLEEDTNLYLDVSSKDVNILLQETINVTFYLRADGPVPPTYSIEVSFISDNKNIIKPIPPATITQDGNITISIEPLQAGHVVIQANTSSDVRTADGFVRVDVMKSVALETISSVVGWMYFVAWSVSFYPQIYENFKRKSVIGLNFDFLTLNLVGFTVYSTFNVGLFFIPTIQDEYFVEHPTGVNPVQPNDVFFSLHAVAACTINIVQCFIYQRGQQRVSRICILLLILFGLFLSSSLISTLVGALSWLQFLYFCSYVKLIITLIKYIPQAYMNYRRKSTVGWSIGNIFLDFTGGALSILQMFLIGFNNDDWGSIFGDPTKFGLGLFSILFDILFLFQHYGLYRDSLPHQELDGMDRERSPSPNLEHPTMADDL
jgi:cystinosin